MSFTNESYANLPYWNHLPMGISNYGGDYQIYTVPEYMGTDSIGMALNGQALAQIPPFTYTPMGGATIDAGAVEDLARTWATPVIANAATQKANMVLQMIT